MAHLNKYEDKQEFEDDKNNRQYPAVSYIDDNPIEVIYETIKSNN